MTDIVQTASILITTRNRKDELRVALQSTFRQTAQPEVIVIDDGSTDGTSEMVCSEFPQARLIRHEESRGLIVRRNEGARLAAGQVVFSIDDDAEFSTPHVVEQTLKDFDDPRIGAIAVPLLEPKKGNRVMQSAPDAGGTWITNSFIGTAHALRKDLFLSLGGYRESLVHQGEEGDFAVRLLVAGYVVRLGRSDSIVHWESPKRDFRRMDFYGTRNSILFQWQNAPLGSLPLAFIATTFNCLRWSLAPARFWVRFQGVWAGYRDCRRFPRQAAPAQSYRLWRQLKKKGPMLLADVVRKLPLVIIAPAK